MNESFKQLIESARRIEPDAAFRARTLGLITTHGQSAMGEFGRGFWQDIAFSAALVAAGIFIMLAGILYSYVNTNTLARRSLSEEEVLKEAQSLEFTIELGEAVYFEDSADAVAAALDQISGSKKREAPEAN